MRYAAPLLLAMLLLVLIGGTAIAAPQHAAPHTAQVSFQADDDSDDDDDGMDYGWIGLLGLLGLAGLLRKPKTEVRSMTTTTGVRPADTDMTRRP